MTADDDRHRRSPDRVRVGLLQGQLTPEPGAPPAAPAGGAPPRHRPGPSIELAAPAGGASPRYRLRPSIEPFPASSGDVYLLRPGEAPDLVVRAPDQVDRLLLELLAAGPRTGAELLAAVEERGLRVEQSALETKLDALVQAGAALIETAAPVQLSPTDAARFARQLPYFGEAGDPAAAQRRLRAATVAILGCGGLGTWALGALACVGVGAFVLVDDDTVELSNLNRQILYAAGDVGRPKATTAAAWVRRFDPAIEVRPVRRRVRGPGDLRPLLDGADVLIDAADWPPYELGRWVDAACLDAGVPHLMAGQVPPVLKIGPTYVPGRSACFACHERGLRREFPLYDELAAYRREHDTTATTLGPASGVVGSLLALEVLHLLVGDGPVATEGRTLIVDMRTLETRWYDIARDPDCPACA